MRLAVVDDHGLTELYRQLNLPPEKLLLLGLVRVVPVIVKADLADGRTFALPRQPRDLIKVLLREVSQLLRVYPDRRVDMLIARCKLYRRTAAFHVAARIDDQRHTAFRERGKQAVPVLVKSPVVIVRMCVKIHLLLLRDPACFYYIIILRILQARRLTFFDAQCKIYIL